jgi:hypothetical protein
MSLVSCGLQYHLRRERIVYSSSRYSNESMYPSYYSFISIAHVTCTTRPSSSISRHLYAILMQYSKESVQHCLPCNAMQNSKSRIQLHIPPMPCHHVVRLSQMQISGLPSQTLHHPTQISSRSRSLAAQVVRPQQSYSSSASSVCLLRLMNGGFLPSFPFPHPRPSHR